VSDATAEVYKVVAYDVARQVEDLIHRVKERTGYARHNGSYRSPDLTAALNHLRDAELRLDAYAKTERQ
jgi:hypothetical protein